MDHRHRHSARGLRRAYRLLADCAVSEGALRPRRSEPAGGPTIIAGAASSRRGFFFDAVQHTPEMSMGATKHRVVIFGIVAGTQARASHHCLQCQKGAIILTRYTTWCATPLPGCHRLLRQDATQLWVSQHLGRECRGIHSSGRGHSRQSRCAAAAMATMAAWCRGCWRLPSAPVAITLPTPQPKPPACIVTTKPLRPWLQ